MACSSEQNKECMYSAIRTKITKLFFFTNTDRLQWVFPYMAL